MSFTEAMRYYQAPVEDAGTGGSSNEEETKTQDLPSHEVCTRVHALCKALEEMMVYPQPRFILELRRSSNPHFVWERKFGNKNLQELWQDKDFQEAVEFILRDSLEISGFNKLIHRENHPFSLSFSNEGATVLLDPEARDITITCPELLESLFGADTGKWINFSSTEDVTITIGISNEDRAKPYYKRFKPPGFVYNPDAQKLHFSADTLGLFSKIEVHHPVHIGKIAKKATIVVALPERSTNPSPEVIINTLSSVITIVNPAHVQIDEVPAETQRIVIMPDLRNTTPDQNGSFIVKMDRLYGSDENCPTVIDLSHEGTIEIDQAVIAADGETAANLLHSAPRLHITTLALRNLEGPLADQQRLTLQTLWHQLRGTGPLGREFHSIEHVVTIDAVQNAADQTLLFTNVAAAQITDPEHPNMEIKMRGFAALRCSPVGNGIHTQNPNPLEPLWMCTGYQRVIALTDTYEEIRLDHPQIRNINTLIPPLNGDMSNVLPTFARLSSVAEIYHPKSHLKPDSAE